MIAATTTPAIEEDRPPPGPTSFETRNAALEHANRTLCERNRNLSAKTRQAEAIFNALAERMYGNATPPIAEIERAAAYFHDTAKFEADFVWPIGPADVPTAGQGAA